MQPYSIKDITGGGLGGFKDLYSILFYFSASCVGLKSDNLVSYSFPMPCILAIMDSIPLEL